VKSKVLLVIRWPVGGIRTFIRYVYRNFDTNLWEFTIIAPDLDEVRVLMEDLGGLDVTFSLVKGMPRDGSSGLVKMLGCVAAQVARKNFHLIHSHGFISGMCAAIPTFLKRIPHLMTFHEILVAEQFKGVKGLMKKGLMSQLFRLIKTIHSVSHDAQENLFSFFPRLGREEGKCVVIPNGIEVERFLNADIRNLRSELGLDGKDFLIGFLGRFMTPKGFGYLIDAIEILSRKPGLPRRPLVLAFGDGGFIREEKEAIGVRRLDSFFRFMAFTPNVAGTIKGLDLVAMPSIWEACPLQAMETLVCGTPLVGTDCIGLREVLKGTPAAVVRKADALQLARTIEYEMAHPSKAKSLAFQNEAASRFDVRKQSLQLAQTYLELLSRPRS
jgi:glycosyltransferase involved in cell wall biosynthesis